MLRLAIACCLLVATGCNKRYQPRQYTCETDADCAISCAIPDDCCGAGCQCDRPYHRDELEAIRAHNKTRCAGKKLDCPYYSCPEPTTRVLPACQSGRCVAVDVSAACESDADCALSSPALERTARCVERQCVLE